MPAATGKDPVDAMCDLLLSENGRILVTQFAASEQDLRYYPGMLGPYVREKKLVSSRSDPQDDFAAGLEHAMRLVMARMRFPEPWKAIRMHRRSLEQTLGFLGRGLPRPGMRADLVMLHPERPTSETLSSSPWASNTCWSTERRSQDTAGTPVPGPGRFCGREME